MTSLFISVAAMGKCKQINNSILPYVTNIISLTIHEYYYNREPEWEWDYTTATIGIVICDVKKMLLPDY